MRLQLPTYSRQILEYLGLLGLLAWLESRRRRPALVVALVVTYVVGVLGVRIAPAPGLAAACCAREETA